MDAILMIAIAIPLIAAIVVRFVFQQTITWLEAAVQSLLVIAIVSGAWAVGRYSGAWDTELWNGEIVKKEIQREDCPWGWRDSTHWFCTEYRTRSVKDGQTCSTVDGKTTCRDKYKTQYKYIYDWEQKFYLYTNVEKTFTIPRVDAQGAKTPPRFSAAYVGEPVAVENGYSNWVRGAVNSLYHEDGAVEEKYKDILPEYPIAVYDYYKVNRVVKVGNVQIHPATNEYLREALKTLGPQRQMNAVLVVVDANVADQSFPYAVRRYWMGFKKNDAVVFVGVKDGNLAWSQVMSWSKKSLFDIALRDKINESIGKPVDYAGVIADLKTIGLQHYERRSMKEFEYLKAMIPVPTWLTILVMVVSLLGTVGLTMLFHRIDLASTIASATNNRRIYK